MIICKIYLFKHNNNVHKCPLWLRLGWMNVIQKRRYSECERDFKLFFCLVFNAIATESCSINLATARQDWSCFIIATTSEVISLYQPSAHWIMLDVPRNLILTHAQWHWKWSETFFLTHCSYTELSDWLEDPTRVLRYTQYAWTQSLNLTQHSHKQIFFSSSWPLLEYLFFGAWQTCCSQDTKS